MFEEKLFQFIWQNRCFDQKHLHTLQGDVVEIIAQGNLNHQGGPDFLNAKIKIGQNIWVGHIELHLKTSDWNKHKHQFDKKYDNVILHVVFQNDIDFETQNLPILELNGRISRQLLNVYHQQMKNSDLLLCKNLGKDVPSIIWTNWKERLMLERLQKKASSIQLDYEILNKDWNQVAYIQMAKYFGVPSNKDNFHQLAFNIDYRILLKNHQNLFAIESILFGTSGLVDIESKEKYPNNLKEEFEFWQQKYDLKKMKSYQWQWLRMRPNSFPTIRIALFSALCQEMLPFFDKLINQPSDFIKKIANISASTYWDNHYNFQKTSISRKKIIGNTLAYNIAVNVIAPILVCYGNTTGEYHYTEKAIALLYSLAPEKNAITSIFNNLNIHHKDAAESQALVELYTNYCKNKRCLNCAIGCSILKNMSIFDEENNKNATIIREENAIYS